LTNCSAVSFHQTETLAAAAVLQGEEEDAIKPNELLLSKIKQVELR
jgi:hypothetical protein